MSNKQEKTPRNTSSENNKAEGNWNNIKNEIKFFFKNTLSIGEIDYSATIEGIKKDMVFKGHTVWILMFSILIASIGLNANSTAVIIGAMLISPLMGPIVAIGLAIGIHDWETLKKALRYLLVAVTISLLTSALYFWLTPLKEAQSELLARTKPTFLDVLIALFGGFAGIIVGAKREKSNVIPGVAIATALMPPLCTAGYGIGTGQWRFFLGAMYLFFINSVFISIATLITVKYLKFPHKQFIDSEREKRIKRYITFFAIIVILPSALIFWNVIKESRFKTSAQLLANDINQQLPQSQLIEKKIFYSDTVAYIDLYFIGKPITTDQIIEFHKLLKKYNLVANGNFFKKLMAPDSTVLNIYQAKDNTELFEQQLQHLDATLRQEIKSDIIEDLYHKNEELLKDKEKQIAFLEDQLIKFTSDTFPIAQLAKELNVEYSGIRKFALAKTVLYVNDTTIDTIPVFIADWKPGYSNWYKRKEGEKLAKWLKFRLKVDTIIVVNSQL